MAVSIALMVLKLVLSDYGIETMHLEFK